MVHEGAWKSRRVIDKTEDMNKQLLPLSWECYTDLEPMVTSSTLKANRRSVAPVGTMMIVQKEEEEKRKTRWN